MTVSDTLETILTLRGAEAVIEGFTGLGERLLETAEHGQRLEEAEKALETAQLSLLGPVTAMAAQQKEVLAALAESVVGFGATATAEGVMTAATGVLAAAVDVLLAPLTLIVGALALLTAGVGIATKSLEAFSKGEAVTARLALQMKNLKDVFPTGELVEFADHLERLTGISHSTIEALGGTAAQFGLTKSQIEKLLPVTLDIAAAKGIDPGEVLNRLLRASRGRAQGLVALGIDPSKIQGDLHDVDNLINQVGKGFSGVAEGFRNTLPGTTQALGTAIEHLFEALGRFISPVVVPLLNILISGIEKLTELLTRLADAFPHLFPTAAGLGGGKGSDLAFKGDPEQTEHLKSIDANTKKAADAFVQNVLGGTGTIARQAMTMRDARLAFGI